MLTRKELESMGVIMTDEQWGEFCKMQSEMLDKMWEEAHPLDD